MGPKKRPAAAVIPSLAKKSSAATAKAKGKQPPKAAPKGRPSTASALTSKAAAAAAAAASRKSLAKQQREEEVEEEEEEEEGEEEGEGEEEEEGEGEGEEEKGQNEPDKEVSAAEAGTPIQVKREHTPKSKEPILSGAAASPGASSAAAKAGSPATSAKAQTSATKVLATSPAAAEPAVAPVPGRLCVDYPLPESSSTNSISEGLVELRKAGKFCDFAFVLNDQRLLCHKAVLAASSSILAGKLEDSQELALADTSPEAADLFLRYIYGEVSLENYLPTSHEVNSQVLKLAFDYALPSLKQLAAARMASDATASGVVERVKLCEAYDLPDLRQAFVDAIVSDPSHLAEVARDPATLGHPSLMRELLSAVAGGFQKKPRVE